MILSTDAVNGIRYFKSEEIMWFQLFYHFDSSQQEVTIAFSALQLFNSWQCIRWIPLLFSSLKHASSPYAQKPVLFLTETHILFFPALNEITVTILYTDIYWWMSMLS